VRLSISSNSHPRQNAAPSLKRQSTTMRLTCYVLTNSAPMRTCHHFSGTDRGANHIPISSSSSSPQHLIMLLIPHRQFNRNPPIQGPNTFAAECFPGGASATLHQSNCFLRRAVQGPGQTQRSAWFSRSCSMDLALLYPCSIANSDAPPAFCFPASHRGISHNPGLSMLKGKPVGPPNCDPKTGALHPPCQLWFLFLRFHLWGEVTCPCLGCQDELFGVGYLKIWMLRPCPPPFMVAGLGRTEVESGFAPTG